VVYRRVIAPAVAGAIPLGGFRLMACWAAPTPWPLAAPALLARRAWARRHDGDQPAGSVAADRGTSTSPVRGMCFHAARAPTKAEMVDSMITRYMSWR
jgi:hypothetical protein